MVLRCALVFFWSFYPHIQFGRIRCNGFTDVFTRPPIYVPCVQFCNGGRREGGRPRLETPLNCDSQKRPYLRVICFQLGMVPCPFCSCNAWWVVFLDVAFGYTGAMGRVLDVVCCNNRRYKGKDHGPCPPHSSWLCSTYSDYPRSFSQDVINFSQFIKILLCLPNRARIIFIMFPRVCIYRIYIILNLIYIKIKIKVKYMITNIYIFNISLYKLNSIPYQCITYHRSPIGIFLIHCFL